MKQYGEPKPMALQTNVGWVTTMNRNTTAAAMWGRRILRTPSKYTVSDQCNVAPSVCSAFGQTAGIPPQSAVRMEVARNRAEILLQGFMWVAWTCSCRPSTDVNGGAWVATYNQGILLPGLAKLARATKNQSLLMQACDTVLLSWRT